MLAADYPLLDIFWTMIIFFLWVTWFWILFTVWADVFRRDDVSGWTKAAWLFFTIVLPFLGVFIYLATQNDGMTKRTATRARRQRAQFDASIRETAGGGGPAAEIEKASRLLDSGAITQYEFDVIKAKVLA